MKHHTILLVACDYEGRLHFTMTANYAVKYWHWGEFVYECEDFSEDGRVAVFRQIKGPAKKGPMHCVDLVRFALNGVEGVFQDGWCQ